MLWVTLIARQGPALFLSAQAVGNSGWSLCICLTLLALGFKHKLCITNVFYLKLISASHSRGVFAIGISRIDGSRGKKKWKECNGSCDSTVPPLLSRRRLIVNGRPLGCGNTPSGPYPCSGKSRDYCQGIRACHSASPPLPLPNPLNLTFITKIIKKKKNTGCVWRTRHILA